MPDVQSDLGDAMASASAIGDHDMREHAEMQVYLMSAFIGALNKLSEAIRDAR